MNTSMTRGGSAAHTRGRVGSRRSGARVRSPLTPRAFVSSDRPLHGWLPIPDVDLSRWTDGSALTKSGRKGALAPGR
jgi:hypothetical protein